MKTQLEQLRAKAEQELLSVQHAERLRIFEVTYLGRKGELTTYLKQLATLPLQERRTIGPLLQEMKQWLARAVEDKRRTLDAGTSSSCDVTLPGIRPPEGHLHIVSQAIAEIEDIFARIGFYRSRHPEVDSDWYAFESLNMPKDHSARDDWETYFVQSPKSKVQSPKQIINHKSEILNLVLTPHTSNGQVREMEKGRLPIRMINIGKCYRRQSDISHVPMFHQFEGLYVDTNVTIAHLKGVIEYFVHQFFGAEREFRLRPFHFRFTEPSFEIDISCDVCGGPPSGRASPASPRRVEAGPNGGKGCRLCKGGWLELGGAGMVHPNVLEAGKIDPDEYSGFAFGWGVERTYMMKEGLKVDDIRLLYKNDLRFLEQF